MKPVYHEFATRDSPAFAYDSRGTRLLSQFPCEFGDDTEFMPFSVVQRGVEKPTRIGARTKVDHHALVGHDCDVGADCIIAAHAVLCGHVTVETNAYLGASCVVRQRLRIGRNAMIGMGAVVVRDVPPNCVVVGSPARFLKYRFPNEPESRLWRWDGERWS